MMTDSVFDEFNQADRLQVLYGKLKSDLIDILHRYRRQEIPTADAAADLIIKLKAAEIERLTAETKDSGEREVAAWAERDQYMASNVKLVAEIGRLKAERDDAQKYLFVAIDVAMDRAMNKAKATEAEIERLKAALEPFARNAESPSLAGALGHITRTHLLDARDALAPQGDRQTGARR